MKRSEYSYKKILLFLIYLHSYNYVQRNYFHDMKNRSFLSNFCLAGFCYVFFLIHDEYGIGLNVDFPSKSTS